MAARNAAAAERALTLSSGSTVIVKGVTPSTYRIDTEISSFEPVSAILAEVVHATFWRRWHLKPHVGRAVAELAGLRGLAQ